MSDFEKDTDEWITEADNWERFRTELTLQQTIQLCNYRIDLKTISQNYPELPESFIKQVKRK